MRKLQRQYGLTYLFISHDLSVIRYMADTIGVMYFGKIVEIGPAEDICTTPAHPYTAGLIEAVPAVTGGSLRRAATLAPRRPGSAGEISGPTADTIAATHPPEGCRFRSRCPIAAGICAEQEPPLQPHLPTGQLVACHFPLDPGAPDRHSGHQIPSIA
jgi:peptide/nickel transport system ATP-binding protein